MAEKKEKTLVEQYGKKAAEYITKLGQVDMEKVREQEEKKAEDRRLKLADLEAYYRQQLDGILNAQTRYRNPAATKKDLEALEAAQAEQYNRALNAWLAVRQEMGEDASADDTAYSYLQAADARGWRTGDIGSDIDFDAVRQGYAGRQEERANRASGFGAGQDASGLWLPEKAEKKYGYGGGVVGADENGKGGVYVPAGMYTAEEFEKASVDPYARVGEDGLTDGQRLLASAAARREADQQAWLASLIDSPAPYGERNDTTGWLSDEYPDIDTHAANLNDAGIHYTEAGRAYLEQLEAKRKEEEEKQSTTSQAAALAAALANAGAAGAASTGGTGGSGFGSHHSGVVPNSISNAEIQRKAGAMGKDAYLSMLDAMARGMANTGGYTNTAALQSANSVYDSYRDSLDNLSASSISESIYNNKLKSAGQQALSAAYSRYLGDSSVRAGNPEYTWLSRRENGGFGTTGAAWRANAQATQGNIGRIPAVSGGGTAQPVPGVVGGGSTPVSGTPVRASGQYRMPGQGLLAPGTMRTQDTDFLRYLSQYFKK